MKKERSKDPFSSLLIDFQTNFVHPLRRKGCTLLLFNFSKLSPLEKLSFDRSNEICDRRWREKERITVRKWGGRKKERLAKRTRIIRCVAFTCFPTGITAIRIYYPATRKLDWPHNTPYLHLHTFIRIYCSELNRFRSTGYTSSINLADDSIELIDLRVSNFYHTLLLFWFWKWRIFQDFFFVS